MNTVSSEIRGKGLDFSGESPTWRLNDGCCNIEAQPLEVSNTNIKLLQGTLDLIL